MSNPPHLKPKMTLSGHSRAVIGTKDLRISHRKLTPRNKYSTELCPQFIAYRRKKL